MKKGKLSKKVFVLLLSFMMVITLLPTIAFAGTEELQWFSPNEKGQWQGPAPTIENDKFDFDYTASNDGTNLKIHVKYYGNLSGSDAGYGNGKGTNFRIWLNLPETEFKSYGYFIDVSKKTSTWDSMMKKNGSKDGNANTTVIYDYGETPQVTYNVTTTAKGADLELTVPLALIEASGLTNKQINMVVTLSNNLGTNYCLHSSNQGNAPTSAAEWSKDGYAVVKQNEALYIFSKYPHEPVPEPVAAKDAAKIVRNGHDIKTYDTLNEAITEAKDGDVVMLLKAQNLGDVNIKKNITLDLGGFDCHLNSMLLGQWNCGDYNITVQNGTIIAGSTSTGGGTEPSAVLVTLYSNGNDQNKRIFSNVEFKFKGLQTSQMFSSSQKAFLEFDGCTFDVDTCKGNFIYNNGGGVLFKNCDVETKDVDGSFSACWLDKTTVHGYYVTDTPGLISFDNTKVDSEGFGSQVFNQQKINVINKSNVLIKNITEKGINQSVLTVDDAKLTFDGIDNGTNNFGIQCSTVNVKNSAELTFKNVRFNGMQECNITVDDATLSTINCGVAGIRSTGDEQLVLKNRAKVVVDGTGDEGLAVCNIKMDSKSELELKNIDWSALKNCDLDIKDATLKIDQVGYIGINNGTANIGKDAKVTISNCGTEKYEYDYNEDTCIKATGIITIDKDADVICNGKVISAAEGNVSIYGGKYDSVTTDGGEMTLYGGIYKSKPAEELPAENYVVISNTDAKTRDKYPWTIGHNVTFMDGVDKYAVVGVKHEQKVDKALVKNPTKSGNAFVGWLDEDGEIFLFDTSIAKNRLITANWLSDEAVGNITVKETGKGIKAETSIKNTDIPLSAEERDLVEAGSKLNVNLVVKVEEATDVDEDEVKLIKKIMNDDQKLGMYLDCSLFKTLDGEPIGEIHETLNPITIVLTVPKNLRLDGRVYSIVRVHNGVVETLFKGKADKEWKISFATDKFSTYAILYEGGTPATGDYNNIGLFVSLGGFALLGIISLAVAMFKRKSYKR